MKRNCLLGLMVFVFLCSTSVWAAPSMVLKMALGDPKDSEMGVVGETFKKYVEEKSGGAIEVQSDEGQGTTVVLTVPDGATRGREDTTDRVKALEAP